MTPNETQRYASEQGEMFRNACVKALEYTGWEIIGTEFRVPEVGLTLDIHAQNLCSIDFLFECKGSMRGKRPGCIRTDTVKKAIANGVTLHWSPVREFFPPMLLMTSHVAKTGDALAALQCTPTRAILDVLNPWNHGERLEMWANANEDEIRGWMQRHLTLATILRESWGICSPTVVEPRQAPLQFDLMEV